jgi:mono/diheme cytochrome c family protein
MKKWLVLIVVLGAAGWWFTRPVGLSGDDLPRHVADLDNGERMFNAGGCASCHGRVGDGGLDKAVMAGGLEMSSPVGTFRVPNISPDPEHGIGAWTTLEFVNAMQRGVAPGGRHYYPAFPYTSYTRMRIEDVLDLKAWLDTLPPSDNVVGDHELGFPWRLSRGIGLWKRLYLDDAPVIPVPDDGPVLQRGRYLVEGPGHCGECHTPRNFAQAMNLARWLAGAPNPEGEGRIPGLNPARASFADWSADDIAYYLEAGVDPEFDVVGGSMASVQDNLSRLPAEDRQAIAAYLKALPPAE